MKSVRKRLSYGNVVATLALFLALSGGAALAASKITIEADRQGRGQEQEPRQERGQEQEPGEELGDVAETGEERGQERRNVADGAINFAKLAAGTDVVASATGGPIPVNQDFATVPLNPPLTVTPVAGQPLTVSLEARGTLIPRGTIHL